MTRIGPLTLGGVRTIAESDYGVTLQAWVDTEDEFTKIKELFAKASTSTVVDVVPGIVPQGYDHTEDSICTQYCEFTKQAIMKLRDGWYLLRGLDYETPARRPRFLFNLTLFYLASWEALKPGLRLTALERDTDNDWGI